MFISVSTKIYDHLPLEESLKRLLGIGFENVEISHIHLKKIKDKGLSLSRIAEIPINIHSIHSCHFDLTSPDFASSYQDIYRELFSISKGLGAGIFVTHPGEGKFEEWNGIKEDVFHHCQLLADLAKGYNLTIGLENDWGGGGPIRKPEQFEELIKRVSRENFGITLDAKHSMRFRSFPPDHQANGPEEFIERLSGHIVNFHAIDIDVPVTIVGCGDWQIPGTGSGRLGKVISMLGSSGYQGAVTIEIAEEDVRKFLRALCNILERLDISTGDLGNILADEISLEEKSLICARKYIGETIGK